MDMRGLAHFIRDIRKATSNLREEKERVDEELAKVRAKFSNSVNMSTYDRKKYVCKLMFISMLGYPITFGHLEGLELMAGQTLSEKLIGYLSVAVFLNEDSELLTLTAHTVYRDLLSFSDLDRGLALSVVASTGGKDFAEIMHEGVQKIIVDDVVDIHIRKKALLTLLHIYKKYPEVVDLPLIIPKAADLILSEQDGASMCAIKFLHGCVEKQNMHLFKEVPLKLIDVLARIIIEKKTEPSYVYYGVPAPWLQCSLLRLLQCLPIPEESHLKDRIVVILRKMVKATDKVVKDAQTQLKQKGIRNRVSIMSAVLLEVVSLSVVWNISPKLTWECIDVVSSFVLEKRDTNFRYIGLDLLRKLRHVDIPEFTYQAYCKQYQSQIIVSLHDADVSIRRKALDVLVGMCNASNSSDIIKTLLVYLPVADEPDFRMYLVSSIAFLSGKYIDDPNAYTDIMLTIVAQAGNTCPADIVHRVVRVIINNPSVQKHAVSTVFHALHNRKHPCEPMVQVAAFVLGECGYQIALNPESTPPQQFAALDNQLGFSSTATQAMILTALFKFYNVYDDAALRDKIVKSFDAYKSCIQPELHQRAMEYLALIESGSRMLIDRLLQPIPPFSINDYASFDREGEHAQEAWTAHAVPSEKNVSHDSHAQPQGSFVPSDEKVGQGRFEPSTVSSLKLNATTETRTSGNSVTEELFQTIELQDGERLKQAHLDHHNLFVPLLQGQSGVLFVDSYVELQCTQFYRLADCRVSVVIQDRSGRGLEQVSLEILNAEFGLLLQSRGSNATCVLPNGFMTVEFAGRSISPFHSPPLVRLSYRTGVDNDGSDGTVGVEVLYLPIVTTSFISPYEVSCNDDNFQLFDNVKKTTTPLSHTLSTSIDFNKESALRVLAKMGFYVVSTVDDTFMAVGAHATKPKGKTVYMPVACELHLVGEKIEARVYALSHVIQEVVLDMLGLIFEPYS
ncbi:unnamed protein product [Phytomonas sp. EM1]|nr:unnamed protein product [Phytomonas sp. EM1]|eukprot:CCW64516.1 unnamed protein product [Phytomonas sp. isolate EM1]